MTVFPVNSRAALADEAASGLWNRAIARPLALRWGSMQLSTERQVRIRQRLEPILKEFDPELQFITVFVDAARENLGVVVQLDERPLLLKFGWVDFISIPDKLLQDQVVAQLQRKLTSR
ncbi:MAG: hypothetical protein HY648_03405 [Acidobacteria bacterium]|nr:hypothetical protein [Acidobacteriota bacterium]